MAMISSMLSAQGTWMRLSFWQKGYITNASSTATMRGMQKDAVSFMTAATAIKHTSMSSKKIERA